MRCSPLILLCLSCSSANATSSPPPRQHIDETGKAWKLVREAPPSEPSEAPDWFHRGSYIEDGDLHAVGIAERRGNRSMVRRVAMMRARAEMSRMFVNVISHGEAMTRDGAQRERWITSASTTKLAGVEVVQIWHSNTGWWGVHLVLPKERLPMAVAALEELEREREAYRKLREQCARERARGGPLSPECQTPETKTKGSLRIQRRSVAGRRATGPPPRRNTPQPKWTKRKGWVDPE